MYLTNSVKYITLYIVIYKPMSMVVIIAFLKKLPLSVGRTIALYAEGSVSIPGRDRQVVKTGFVSCQTLGNGCVTGLLRLPYQRMSRVTIAVGVGQNL